MVGYEPLTITLLILVATVPETPDSGAVNVLTEQEKREGWILLFDGRTTKGWMTPKGQPLPQTHVQDSSLNPHPCDYMLVHEKQWGDFLLSVDVKLSAGCNSGIFFRTSPLKPKPGKDVGWNGIEIAIDDTRTSGMHDTGAIYDLVRPVRNAMKPAGQWNRILLTCRKNLISINVNGEPVTRMNLDEWTEPGKRPDGSNHKFSEIAYRDHPRKGYLGLQDHGRNCWYRNIKLRVLK